jgi:hypothetical protein
MLELAFTVCLLADPANCEERSLLFVDVSPMQCMIGAQSALAPWVEEHPAWRIDSFRCHYLDQRITVL